MSDLIQIITTVASREQGEAIARALVEARLAACVQVLGPLTSVYRWQEKIETSQEWMCLAKTTAELFAAAEQAIRKLHSYEVPEIAAVPLSPVSSDYSRWLEREVRAPA